MDTNDSKDRVQKYTPRVKTIILCGTSRLPENVTAKHVFGFFALEVEVDPEDLKIVDASCTMFPSLGEKLLLTSLIGYEVEEGLKNAVEQIERRFFSTTKKAVIAAIEDIYARYVEYFMDKKNTEKTNIVNNINKEKAEA